jgi:hypothetical protein
MKKILVAILALSTASAFAEGSMVKLDGCTTDGVCDGLNFTMNSETHENTVADDDTSETSFGLNYAMAFAGNYGAGLTYVSKNKATDGDVGAVGDKYNMIGLSFYWNKDGSWSDSCFAALHYNMLTVDDTTATTDSGNKNTDIVLEYGHRFKLGKMMGVNWNWVPSVAYTMGTTVYNNSAADDDKATNLTINVGNFAIAY